MAILPAAVVYSPHVIHSRLLSFRQVPIKDITTLLQHRWAPTAAGALKKFQINTSLILSR
ncbi:Alanine racemase [Pseudomonas syringae pv. actinidiae]|uniref:Alanine racemase n=1 Tax=Pseudomonas syringae pv. actinidiae TaxID=103796 RepID=A0AAN4TJN0_PSESF|nr:Alanine racemase [Pseudomonas syringae pv. actinidiae]